MSAGALQIARPRMISKMEELVLSSLIAGDGSTARETHQRIAAMVDFQLLDCWKMLNELAREGLVFKQQKRPGTSQYWIEHPGSLALKRAVITTWVVGGTGLARL